MIFYLLTFARSQGSFENRRQNHMVSTRPSDLANVNARKILFEPRYEKTGLRFFLTWSGTNRAAHSLNMARDIQFRI